MKKLLNFIQFQAVWFICILGAAHQSELPALLLALAIVIWMLLVSENRSHDLWMILIGAGVGFVIDTALIQMGLMSFTTNHWQGVSPLWMTLMWCALVLTLQSSMSWLSGRYALAAILGGISGPFAYWAGARMGAGSFNDLYQSLLALSVIWFIVTPFLFYCSTKLKAIHHDSSNL